MSKDKKSPLYTPKDYAALKAAEVKRLGPDKDGAFRFSYRLDGAK